MVLDKLVYIFHSKAEKIGHNLKFDLSVLLAHDYQVSGPFFDTMLVHALVSPDQRHGMDFASESLLGYSPVKLSVQRVDMLRQALVAWESRQRRYTRLETWHTQVERISDAMTLINHVERISDEATLCPYHLLTPSSRCGRCYVRHYDQQQADSKSIAGATLERKQLTAKQHQFKQNDELQEHLQHGCTLSSLKSALVTSRNLT